LIKELNYATAKSERFRAQELQPLLEATQWSNIATVPEGLEKSRYGNKPHRHAWVTLYAYT
jgi:hypothetical protein